MTTILRATAIACAGGLLLSMQGSPQQAQQSQPPVQPPAQQQQQQTLPTIRTTVTEVILPVTVTDDKGRFIDNLEQKDFRILDEGRVQRIKFFSHDPRQPTVIGFLVDMSNNSTIHWQNY